MDGAKEAEPAALATLSAPQGALDPGGDGNPVKPSGLTPLSAGKRPSIGEDDAGSAEAKLFGKGLAATSLLQIAIRNGIYQNQVGNAAKNANMPAVKTANLYSLTSGGSSASLLSRRRHKHKRNLSLGAPPTGGSPGGSTAEAAGPAPAASPLSTLSLDRRTFLRQKQSKQLQASDKTWVRSDLRRGCIHVHDWLTPSYPRPVLCTLDTAAKEVASRLEASKAGAALRMECKSSRVDLKDDGKDKTNPREDEGDGLGFCVGAGGARLEEPDTKALHQDTKLLSNLLDDQTASTSSSELCLNDMGADLSLADCCGVHSGSDLESSTCEDFSPGGPRSAELQDSASEGQGPATDSSAPSLNCDSATEGPDPFESSSDELDLTSSPTRPGPDAEPGPGDDAGAAGATAPPPKRPSSSQSRPLTGQSGGPVRGRPEPIVTCPSPALFVQLHGGTVRRLGDEERPLQILKEYLGNLGYEDPWRVQGESMNPEIGCLIRFYFGENIRSYTASFPVFFEGTGGDGGPLSTSALIVAPVHVGGGLNAAFTPPPGLCAGLQETHLEVPGSVGRCGRRLSPFSGQADREDGNQPGRRWCGCEPAGSRLSGSESAVRWRSG